MSETMAEEGNNTAGPSGIVKIKDNFVKITKDRKRFVFITAKSIELVCCFIAAVAESYKALFINDFPARIPEYKNLSIHSDIYFRVVCVALDGLIIFNMILLASFLLGEQLPKKLLCIFSFVGAVYCFAAGGILISDQGDSNHIFNEAKSTEMIVSSVFAILAGLTFVIETLVGYRIYS